MTKYVASRQQTTVKAKFDDVSLTNELQNYSNFMSTTVIVGILFSVALTTMVTLVYLRI